MKDMCQHLKIFKSRGGIIMNYKKLFKETLLIILLAILAITTTACEPSDKPIESIPIETTTAHSQVSVTTPAQTTAPTTTTTTPPSTSQTIETTESETQATTQQEETSAIEELTPLLTDEDYTFINDFGIAMDIRDADLISGIGAYVKPEEMLKENYYTIIYNNFTYLTKSLGVSYNSFDDTYNSETGVFDVEVPEQNHEWFKVYPGDKFESLTVKEVSVDYDSYGGKVYDGDFRVKFSGSLTVTGYINCIIKDGGFVGKGDIIFCVDAETWGDIPIMMRKGISGRLPNVRYKAEMDDFRYSSDIGAIKLGNIYRDDYSDVDLGLIPDDGSYRHVTVKLTDLNMSITTRSDGGGYYAKIESISLLDE